MRKFFLIMLLSRIYDPVVIAGKNLKFLSGEEKSNICAVSFHGGKWKHVLFQIDHRSEGDYLWDYVGEKEGDGDWSFSVQGFKRGKSFRKKRLGKEDEIVFISGDAGDKRDVEDIPLLSPVYEVELIDPLNGKKKYIYFGKCKGKKDERDLIRYVAEKRIVESLDYAYGFTDPQYPGILNLFSIKKDSIYENILDRFKFRLELSFLFGKIVVKKSERDILARVAGFIDGPLRVILKVKYAMKILGDLPTPYVERIVKNYPNMGIYPNNVFIPFSPGLIITGGKLSMSFDFLSTIKGGRIYTEKSHKDFIVNGKREPGEGEILGDFFPLWVVIYNDYGGLIARIRTEASLLKMDTGKKFFYRDDENFRDPYETEPGSYGEVGWEITKLENLKAGNYELDIEVYGKRGFKKGDEREFLNITDHPLKIEVRPLKIY